MAHAAPPALHANDGLALAQNTKLNGVHDTPCEAAVDILLPGVGLEVGLLLGEQEGVDTTVQVRVLRDALVASVTISGHSNLPWWQQRCG